MKGFKMEIAIAAVVGLILGIGGTLLGVNATKQPVQQVDNQVAQTQQEIEKQLTSLDLVEPICKPENMDTPQKIRLCRELLCLQFSRGNQSQTSGSWCEEISNISNRISIMEYCKDKEEEQEKKECIEIFWKRN